MPALPLALRAFSRTFLAQVTRHRIASFSVQSQRYVRLEDFRYVIPPEIEADPAAKAAFIDAMNADAKHYLELVKALEEKHTHTLMEQGMPEKTARAKASKMANEDARFVLPNACETKNGNDHELPQPEQLFQPALLQPCPVGDPRRCR